MKNLTLAFGLAGILLLSGCGGGGNSSIQGNVNTYDIYATSTTNKDKYGSPCGRGEGTLRINGTEVYGTIMDTWGQKLDIKGEIQADGYLYGEYKYGDLEAGFLEGYIVGDSGNGTWEDIMECSGTWEAIKK